MDPNGRHAGSHTRSEHLAGRPSAEPVSELTGSDNFETLTEGLQMNAAQLRAAQQPLKDQYREQPQSAVRTLQAKGHVEPGIICRLEAEGGPVDAGLHPAVGGSGEWGCSGDMLLQSLVACSGVTLAAVATAMGIEVDSAEITAEGDLDFRGTLGVVKDVPVGFSKLRLQFNIQGAASDEQLATLQKLTERYCVIFQTLRTPASISVETVRS